MGAFDVLIGLLAPVQNRPIPDIGAVLMCERAKISDPEVQSLCGRIIQSQKEEVDQMEQILKRR